MTLYGTIEGSFVCFLPLIIGKPYIDLYGDFSDRVLIHEMTHYFLYLKNLPVYLKSNQKYGDAEKFKRKFGKHNREFWSTFREKISIYEQA